MLSRYHQFPLIYPIYFYCNLICIPNESIPAIVIIQYLMLTLLQYFNNAVKQILITAIGNYSIKYYCIRLTSYINFKTIAILWPQTETILLKLLKACSCLLSIEC